MNKKMIYMAIVLVSIAISCKNTSEKEKKNGKNAAMHHGSAVGVILNNGKKWIANPETNTGIAAMIHLIDNYKKGDDVEKLRTSLDSEFQMIFQKCTMTGMAHEQLHNYLLPLKGKLNELNDPKASVKVKEIKTYLADYQNYFE